MTIDDVRAALDRIKWPSFVGEIWVNCSEVSFNTWPDINRDYCLQVRIGKPFEHDDVYKPGHRAAITNNPFHLPADEDEFRQQVVAAILMGVAHETIEQVSAGGKHTWAPHQHKGGSPADSKQWLFLLDSLLTVVDNYAEMMPTEAQL